MPLFCPVLLLAIFDLYRVTGNLGYLLGVSLTYGLLTAVLDVNFLGYGYADLPVATFAFLAVYAFLLGGHAPSNSSAWKYLLLGAVFAAGAALTKQAGLIIAAMYPVLCYLFLRQPRGAEDIDLVGQTFLSAFRRPLFRQTRMSAPLADHSPAARHDTGGGPYRRACGPAGTSTRQWPFDPVKTRRRLARSSSAFTRDAAYWNGWPTPDSY